MRPLILRDGSTRLPARLLPNDGRRAWRLLASIPLCLGIAFAGGLPQARAAGIASNDNFIVLTPKHGTQDERTALARELLARAEQFRREIALEWLGQELPPGVGRTHVHLSFCDTRDRGLTWARSPNSGRYHAVYLTTSPERALGSTLAHEIAHVVLATQFGSQPLPAWVDEGIASRYDDAQRVERRERTVAWLASTGNWPSLLELFSQADIASHDAASYSVAASVVEFLLTRGDRPTLLDFARDGQHGGYDAAAAKHYGFRSLRELQHAWQGWTTTSDAASHRGS